MALRLIGLGSPGKPVCLLTHQIIAGRKPQINGGGINTQRSLPREFERKFSGLGSLREGRSHHQKMSGDPFAEGRRS